MDSSTPLTQSALLVVLTLLSFALSCWIARYPRNGAMGVALGVLAGVALTNLASALVAFLGQTVPFGAIDFWLAHLISALAP